MSEVPYYNRRWAIVENGVITEVQQQNFTYNDVEFTQNTFQQTVEEIKALGLYHIVYPAFAKGTFQQAVIYPLADATIDNTDKSITLKVEVLDNRWQDVKNMMIGYVRNSLEAMAQEKGYDSVIALASYANSTNATYKAEALKMITLRDAAWEALYVLISDIENGSKTEPKDVSDITAALPAFVWSN